MSPLARDRLIGLSGVPQNFVAVMEDTDKPRFPFRLAKSDISGNLNKIIVLVKKMLDTDIFPWYLDQRKPNKTEKYRAATVIADRLCGSLANPIIRNAQEERQLSTLSKFLTKEGYVKWTRGGDFREMPSKTFSFHTNVPVNVGKRNVNVQIDLVIQPQTVSFPLFIEAKSAGDFTNVNKRRKEEAIKMRQLLDTYGDKISYTLFLCGYFDTGYLGYEAAGGIDWIWEHKISDIKKLGI